MTATYVSTPHICGYSLRALATSLSSFATKILDSLVGPLRYTFPRGVKQHLLVPTHQQHKPAPVLIEVHPAIHVPRPNPQRRCGGVVSEWDGVGFMATHE